MPWKLEDAKNRFSELVRKARAEGPQLVTKHGRDAVVVLDVDEYRTLTSGGDFVTFFADSPFGRAVRSGELDLDRDQDTGREIQL